MVELMFIEKTPDEIEDEEYRNNMRPEPSTILFQIIDGDSYMFDKWNPETKKNDPLYLELGEYAYEGGSADLEAESGMLPDSFVSLLDDNEKKVGWFVMEGFYGTYRTDYYGEVDCDFECDNIRKAKFSDLDYFGYAPWWAKLLLKIGINLEINSRYGHPK